MSTQSSRDGRPLPQVIVNSDTVRRYLTATGWRLREMEWSHPLMANPRKVVEDDMIGHREKPLDGFYVLVLACIGMLASDGGATTERDSNLLVHARLVLCQTADKLLCRAVAIRRSMPSLGSSESETAAAHELELAADQLLEEAGVIPDRWKATIHGWIA